VKIDRIAGRLLVVGAIASLTLVGIAAFRADRAIDAARRENVALKERQEALRGEAFELGGRAADAVELGQWVARSIGTDRQQTRITCAPSRNATNESILAWLSSQSEQLEAVADDLSAIGEQAGFRQPLDSSASDANAAPEESSR
jgi:hypothetical protein